MNEIGNHFKIKSLRECSWENIQIKRVFFLIIPRNAALGSTNVAEINKASAKIKDRDWSRRCLGSVRNCCLVSSLLTSTKLLNHRVGRPEVTGLCRLFVVYPSITARWLQCKHADPLLINMHRPWLWSLADQSSKSPRNPEHRQSVIICSLAHFHFFVNFIESHHNVLKLFC